MIHYRQRVSLIFCVMAVVAFVDSTGEYSTEEISNMIDDQEVDEILLDDAASLGTSKNNLGSFNCKDKPRISRFPFPRDCTKFIYCVAGTPYPGKCLNGKHFNPKSQLCDEIGKVASCLPLASSSSSGLTTPQPVLPRPPAPVTVPWLMQSVPATTLIPSIMTQVPVQVTIQTTNIRPQQLELDSTTLIPLGVLVPPEISSASLSTNSSSSLTTPTPYIPTTTMKPRLLQERFMFVLDCKSKHPCGLYPNTNGDCTSFYLCGENGTLITKHCHGGQIFDIRTLECQEPSEAECWTEPDSGPFVQSPRIQSSCHFHNNTPAASYVNQTDGGIILSSPVVTNLGSWLPWTLCPPGHFITGMNAWRRLLQQGNDVDQAGLVSLGFQCENLLGSNPSTATIESLAPGVPHDGWPSFYSCSSGGGVAVGFRLNSQPDQGPWPKDNVATDNVQIICSCGSSPVFKPYDSIPGPQSGHRGVWTQEQICKPRQALCGMQAHMVDYKERLVGSYDNTGLHNLKMKCCPVNDPVENCVPKEEVRLVRRCKNTVGIYPRRCDFETEVGVGHSLNVGGGLRAINFYESIGFSLEDARDKIRDRFTEELQIGNFSFSNNSSSAGVIPEFEYDWENSRNRSKLWEEINSKVNGSRSKETIYLDLGTKAEVFQIIGTCSHFTVKTNRFFKKVVDILSGNETKEYFDVL